LCLSYTVSQAHQRPVGHRVMPGALRLRGSASPCRNRRLSAHPEYGVAAGPRRGIDRPAPGPVPRRRELHELGGSSRGAYGMVGEVRVGQASCRLSPRRVGHLRCPFCRKKAPRHGECGCCRAERRLCQENWDGVAPNASPAPANASGPGKIGTVMHAMGMRPHRMPPVPGKSGRCRSRWRRVHSRWGFGQENRDGVATGGDAVVLDGVAFTPDGASARKIGTVSQPMETRPHRMRPVPGKLGWCRGGWRRGHT
jgi:hypothetical protein